MSWRDVYEALKPLISLIPLRVYKHYCEVRMFHKSIRDWFCNPDLLEQEHLEHFHVDEREGHRLLGLWFASKLHNPAQHPEGNGEWDIEGLLPAPSDSEAHKRDMAEAVQWWPAHELDALLEDGVAADCSRLAASLCDLRYHELVLRW